MRIDIITLFPEMIANALAHSIIKRAQERGIISINVINLRDFTHDRHRTTDDIPYGGGGGMIMKVEPIARALASLTTTSSPVPSAAYLENTDNAVIEPFPLHSPTQFALSTSQTAVNEVNYSAVGSYLRPRVVLTDPRGPCFTQVVARCWAQEEHLILLCGHYEGVDERVRQYLVTDEISIGDYILTGGELPALIITDALTRLQPDALGDEQAPDKDTFADDLLEYPHYTRPREFNGHAVPDILLCGHHAQIERWRRWHQLRATRDRRPDLFARLDLSAQDLKLLAGEEPTAPSDIKATAYRRAVPGMAHTEHAQPDELPSAKEIASVEVQHFAVDKVSSFSYDSVVTERQDVSTADAPFLPGTTRSIDSSDSFEQTIPVVVETPVEVPEVSPELSIEVSVKDQEDCNGTGT